MPRITYIFQRDEGGPGAWGQIARLRPSDISGMYNRFSWSTSIDGDSVISGAPWYGSANVFTMSVPFFADGFESGDTSEWSVTVP